MRDSRVARSSAAMARERARDVREETPVRSRPRAHSNASACTCRTLFLDSMSAAYFCLRTLAPLDVVDDDVIAVVDPAFSFSFISTRASTSAG